MELKTRCRVREILVDKNDRAKGVIYYDEIDATKIPDDWYSWMHYTKNKIENLHQLNKYEWQKPHQH